MSAEVDEKRSRRRRRGKAEEEVEISEEDKALTAKKGRATTGRRNPQDEEARRGIIGRSGDYLRGVRSELDKVTWPERHDVVRLTRIVILFTIAASLILGLVSLGLTELFVLGLDNPLVFLIFGIAVAGGIFGYMRWSKARAADTSFNSRL